MARASSRNAGDIRRVNDDPHPPGVTSQPDSPQMTASQPSTLPRVSNTLNQERLEYMNGDFGNKSDDANRAPKPVNSGRKGYICIDDSPEKRFLAKCKNCREGKVYGTYYNAAAHLRRSHFNPHKRGRKGKTDERRGGIGGWEDPSLQYLKQYWIKEVDWMKEDDLNEEASNAQRSDSEQPTADDTLLHQRTPSAGPVRSGARTSIVSATPRADSYPVSSHTGASSSNNSASQASSAVGEKQSQVLHGAVSPPAYTNDNPGIDGRIYQEPKIKCICGFFDGDGNSVLCDKCGTWQHVGCYYDSVFHVPEVHKCTDCYPRAVDAKTASEKQRLLRRDSINIGKRKGKPDITTPKSAVVPRAQEPSHLQVQPSTPETTGPSTIMTPEDVTKLQSLSNGLKQKYEAAFQRAFERIRDSNNNGIPDPQSIQNITMWSVTLRTHERAFLEQMRTGSMPRLVTSDEHFSDLSPMQEAIIRSGV